MGVVLLVIDAGYPERLEITLGVSWMLRLGRVFTVVRHAMRQPLTRMSDGGDGDQATGYEPSGQEWGAHGQEYSSGTQCRHPECPCVSTFRRKPIADRQKRATLAKTVSAVVALPKWGSVDGAQRNGFPRAPLGTRSTRHGGDRCDHG